MRALRAVACEGEHLGCERSENARRRFGRRRRPEANGIHRVEVLAHPRQRLGIVPADRLDRRCVADTEPEHEPPGMRFGEGCSAVRGRLGAAEPDARDARRDSHALRRVEQERRVRERLAVERVLTEPERVVPGHLERAHGGALLGGGQHADGSEPGADAAEIHSTVTVFARFRGWSTFSPRRRAMR